MNKFQSEKSRLQAAKISHVKIEGNNMINIVIVYYSRNGHTRRLAQAIADGATTEQTMVTLLDVTQAIDWDLLEQADGIIFGSPTFVGSMAGEFKLFLTRVLSYSC